MYDVVFAVGVAVLLGGWNLLASWRQERQRAEWSRRLAVQARHARAFPVRREEWTAEDILAREG